jgi:hypothetical protein
VTEAGNSRPPAEPAGRGAKRGEGRPAVSPGPTWPHRLLGAILAAVAVGVSAPLIAILLLPVRSIPAIIGSSIVAGAIAAVAGAIWPPRDHRTSWIERWMGATSGIVVGSILLVIIVLAAGGPAISLAALGHAAIAGAVVGALVPTPFVLLISLIPF